MSIEQLQTDLESLKLALNQPRLYVNNSLNELINEIDIQSQMALENEEANKIEILNHQEQMINRIRDFKEICFSNLLDNPLPKENLQANIDMIENDLKCVDKNAKLEEISKIISDNLLNILKVIFQNKSIFFIKNIDCTDYLLEREEKQSLIGIVLILEDSFIDRWNFHKT